MDNKTKSYMISFNGKVIAWEDAESLQEAIDILAKKLQVCVGDNFESEHKDIPNTYLSTEEIRASERAKIADELGKRWEGYKADTDMESEIIADFIEPFIMYLKDINTPKEP